MPYTPTNNPYAVGDPYMYDLKWIVAQIKALNAGIDEKVLAAIEKYLADITATVFYDALTETITLNFNI